MNSKQLQFTNRHGQKLAAQIDLPSESKPQAYALFAHCFTCSRNVKAAYNISRTLNSAGIAVLRFDFTGLGQSEGDFSETNFTTNVSDLIDAAGFMQTHYTAPQILIGHSLGGAAVLQAAGEIKSARAIVVIGTPSKTDHLLKHMAEDRERIESRGEAEVKLEGRVFRIKKQFIDDLSADHMSDTIKKLDRALLILHSPVDRIVGIENATEIFTAAKHPKSFISLDTADHLLSAQADSQYAGSLIAAWSRKYLTLSKTDETAVVTAKDQVVALGGKSGYMTEIITGQHDLVADEPVSMGGTDMGPTPYDYLVAGLGACTAITLRMYADRKKWPLEGIRIGLNHRKIHADDCDECETKNKYVDQIKLALSFKGDLDADQRQRLLEIAARCPVHRTLKGEIRIETKIEA